MTAKMDASKQEATTPEGARGRAHDATESAKQREQKLSERLRPAEAKQARLRGKRLVAMIERLDSSW